MKIAAALLSVFFSLSSALGQEPGATWVAGIDKVPCSIFRSTLDDFLVALSQEPATVGYVVLSDEANYLQVVRRRQMIENHIFWRNFDPKRVIFVRRHGLTDLELEFWKVDRDSKLNFNYVSDWTYELPERSKPFVLVTGGFDASECPPARDGELVARFLKANPRSRINIVIRCGGGHCFRESKTNITEELVGNGVSRSRLRFYYVPIETGYYTYEYWILN